MSPVMVKPRYQNETIPLSTMGAETVIWSDPVPGFALSNRDSFVIDHHGPCRGRRDDRKISVVIRGRGWDGSLRHARNPAVLPAGEEAR